MKYKIGDLLEIKHKATISINTDGSKYKEEEANAGQLFLIIDCSPNSYTLFSQESGNSCLWAGIEGDLDNVMEHTFKKVL